MCLTAAAVVLAVPATASAATFAVNDLGDAHDASFISAADGICDTVDGPPQVCTVRAALEEANSGSSFDEIVFSVPGTVDLTLGQLSATEDEAITGHPAGTTIDAND